MRKGKRGIGFFYFFFGFFFVCLVSGLMESLIRLQINSVGHVHAELRWLRMHYEEKDINKIKKKIKQNVNRVRIHSTLTLPFSPECEQLISVAIMENSYGELTSTR